MGATKIAGLLLIVGLATAGLRAQTNINATNIVLSGASGPNGAITFVGQGSGTSTLGMILGSCAGSSCTLSGAASVGTLSGTASVGADSDTISLTSFSLTSSANSVLLTPTTSGEYYDPYLENEYPDPLNPNAGRGGWVQTQGFAVAATAPILLAISGTYNGDSGTVLVGNLNLSGFETQDWVGADMGRIQEATFTAELNVTGGLGSALRSVGGALSGPIGAQPLFQLSVQLPNYGISYLEGSNDSEIGSQFGGGALNLAPTPEPSTLALLFCGLLVLMILGAPRRRMSMKVRAE